MNPQMQNYRQYAQAQARAPATRRPDKARKMASSSPTGPPQVSLNDSLLRSFNAVAYQGAPAPNLHQNPQHAAQQAQQQLAEQQARQRAIALDHQRAQRIARKPTDLDLPDGLEDICIGDGVKQYNALREAEKRLDALMTRKRLEYLDSASRNNKHFKTMRIFISNTVENQYWQQKFEGDTFSLEDIKPPTYRVRIRGRLMEYKEDQIDYSSDEEEEAEDENEALMPPELKKPKEKTLLEPSRNMSHFWKDMYVEHEGVNHDYTTDPNVTVKWKKGQNGGGDLDTFFFARKGDENQNITICLTRDEQPERFRLSKALADALDTEEADRAEVVMGIWEYVKFFNLQEDDERRTIRCDDSLRQIFGTDTIFFPQVPERIIPHLHPLPPIRLPYTIHVDEEFHKDPKPTIYDVQVMVEDPLRALMLKMTNSPENQARNREIARINDEIAVLMQAIRHSKARHQFFTAFAKDPIEMTKKWIASQKKDLSVILGEPERGDVAGMEFMDEVWQTDLIREAVRYKLAKTDVASGARQG
ncbi:SWI/SNF and RSC complex subunit Ssr3 [Exophiala xenobiotica]|nr:SWI/SNF and RSC complex subunit Ssr3 [Exophiala xenobiotica]KAK5203434.1 SWI/SNF and RSC complex subunit Ssr3 [Exophiala xenobiotica]KAK5216616.1 SWI/SNF and RSC complex subunit Ssr3 [Exophiala xenobiotica]KAK5223313.1 SWI/SNF and RSC complex subunit Ssr3 [Exophiala xenobiotica]KAK5248609.1 SWI/SNF and RSC complex subunit Ssr3 [Exophiala xenobiotica]